MKQEQATPPRRGGGARGGRHRQPPPAWPLVALASLAVLLAVAVLWWGRADSDRASSAIAAGNVRGSPEAPVLIEEWGDFQ